VLGIEHHWPAIFLWNEQEGSGAHSAEAGTTGWRGIPDPGGGSGLMRRSGSPQLDEA